MLNQYKYWAYFRPTIYYCISSNAAAAAVTILFRWLCVRLLFEGSYYMRAVFNIKLGAQNFCSNW